MANETRSWVTRRGLVRLLVGGAAALAGVQALVGRRAATTGAGSDDIENLPAFSTVGTVMSVSAERLVVSTAGTTIEVVGDARTRIVAGVAGRAASLTAIVPGDRVAVDGVRQADGSVRAANVASLLVPVQARIMAVASGHQAETTIGPVDLSGRLPDRESAASRLRAGDSVVGYTWSDPRSGKVYLVTAER